MNALIDIVVTFIAAMVSAAFVHFGAHSEKPSHVAPPAEQNSSAYEPARLETVSDDMAVTRVQTASEIEATNADIEAAHAEARFEAERMVRDREIRTRREQTRTQAAAR